MIPKQIESGRFSDWNEAITDCCYKANTHSRYLDPYGHIKSINNNYQYISWDFGPTLLCWFYQHENGMIHQLRLADKFSSNRTGHSNAMAQGFGHSILPLDTPENRKIQIRWGIEDYRFRYGHDPEGFWCPECAINPETIDDLASAGVRFVVLSPWQAESIRTGKKTTSLEGKSAPYDEPFWIEGKTSRIAAFFYNPDIASGVSFGHLLRDADSFYSYLVSFRKQQKDLRLLHFATDGEIYGHHEPYGDMALAALVKKIEAGDEFEITNYGAYLEKHPPVSTAILKPGDDHLGTSWSCSHGVGRWFRDCGCFTGGGPHWNQSWRTPLRNAFNSLNSTLTSVFKKKVRELFPQNPEEFYLDLLYSYVKIVIHQWNLPTFFYAFGILPEHQLVVAKMLCGMKNLLFSFTSCGWFFNDVAGIEPRQNICYALYAIKQFSDFIPHKVLDDFLEELSLARSNIPEEKTAREIAISIYSGIEGSAEAAISSYLNHLIDSSQSLRRYGYFFIEASEDFSEYYLQSSETLESFSYKISMDPEKKSLLLENLGKRPVFGTLVNWGLPFPPRTKVYTFESLPDRMKDQLSNRIDHYVCVHSKNLVHEIGHSIEVSSLISIKQGNPEPDLDHALYLRAVKQFFNTDIKTLIGEWQSEHLYLAQIISRMSKSAPAATREVLLLIVSDYLNRLAQDLRNNGYSEENLIFCYDLLRTLREAGIEPDITSMQDAIYPYLTDKRYTFPLLQKVAIDLNFDLA